MTGRAVKLGTGRLGLSPSGRIRTKAQDADCPPCCGDPGQRCYVIALMCPTECEHEDFPPYVFIEIGCEATPVERTIVIGGVCYTVYPDAVFANPCDAACVESGRFDLPDDAVIVMGSEVEDCDDALCEECFPEVCPCDCRIANLDQPFGMAYYVSGRQVRRYRCDDGSYNTIEGDASRSGVLSFGTRTNECSGGTKDEFWPAGPALGLPCRAGATSSDPHIASVSGSYKSGSNPFSIGASFSAYINSSYSIGTIHDVVDLREPGQWTINIDNESQGFSQTTTESWAGNCRGPVIVHMTRREQFPGSQERDVVNMIMLASFLNVEPCDIGGGP